MRCKACDVLLEDYEAKAKDSNGNYFDMCNNCISAGFVGLDEENTGIITEEISYSDNLEYDKLDT